MKRSECFVHTFSVMGLVLASLGGRGQEMALPYRELPEYPENYSAGTVAARMIDAVGFRFYWATDGLRTEDLAFRPGRQARTSRETIAHIYSMSFVILNATTKTVNAEGQNKNIAFSEMRKGTLENLKAASERLSRSTEAEMMEWNALFTAGDKSTMLPFWLVINGPISDCLWHVGQVVSFRRSSGNPFSEKVNLFTGQVGTD